MSVLKLNVFELIRLVSDEKREGVLDLRWFDSLLNNRCSDLITAFDCCLKITLPKNSDSFCLEIFKKSDEIKIGCLEVTVSVEGLETTGI